mmetsp:Transcript_143494/g.263634  ORF Transcript_143494/g.263634 Transcript_143494/m.263634 type:complete len:125 (-) Transcript_143494:132-506(-)
MAPMKVMGREKPNAPREGFTLFADSKLIDLVAVHQLLDNVKQRITCPCSPEGGKAPPCFAGLGNKRQGYPETWLRDYHGQATLCHSVVAALCRIMKMAWQHKAEVRIHVGACEIHPSYAVTRAT